MSSNADLKKCFLRCDSGISCERVKVRKRSANLAEFIRIVELQTISTIFDVMCNYYIPRNEYYRLTYLWIPLLALVPK